MIQEELQNAVLQIPIKSLDTLFDVLKLLFSKTNTPIKPHRQGLQSIKDLNNQNVQLDNIPISSEDIKAFKKEMKKQGIDFSVLKRKETNEINIYFKGRDIEQINTVLQRYTEKNLSKERKPNLLAKLNKIKNDLSNVVSLYKSKTQSLER